MITERSAVLLATACLVVLACRPGNEQQTPYSEQLRARELPEPIRPEPKPVATGESVVIRQIPIARPEAWRFEPGGRRVAARVGDSCGVWQLDGTYLGAAEAEAEPCRAWAPLAPLTWVEDGIFTLPHPDGRRQLAIAGDRFELSDGPLQGRARSGRRWLAAAFSPDGARLALMVGHEQGPLNVEIWSVDGARLERLLAFDRTLGNEWDYDPDEWEAKRFWLEWTERSLAAAVDFAPVCLERECHSVRVALVELWPALDRPSMKRRFPVLDDEFSTTVVGLHLDPEHRLLFGLIEGIIPDDGRTAWVFEGIALSDASEIPLQPGMWVDAADERVEPPVRARWQDDVGSSRWTIAEQDCCYEDEIGWNWSVLSLTALPDRTIELVTSEGFVPRQHESDVAPTVDIVGRGRSLPDQAPAGCEVVDADWSFERLLLACDDRWLLVAMPEPDDPIALEGAHELARGTSDQAEAVWSPQGLAIWTFGEGLRLFDDERLVATHTAIVDLRRAVLDEELDLALVRDREAWRVADLQRFELGPRLGWSGPVEFAAFSPERDGVALAGGQELAVFSLAEGEAIQRWSSGKLAGIAFRQDGAVLFVGRDRPLPELALDPATGEQVVEAQLDRVAFARIAAAALDPSWRWAIEPDGTLLRTSDGQALRLFDGASGLAESGWFVGDVPFDDYRVRLGPEPFAAVIDPHAAAELFVRPDLIAEFLSGQPLPPPRIEPL
jgi:hypothetical protein